MATNIGNEVIHTNKRQSFAQSASHGSAIEPAPKYKAIDIAATKVRYCVPTYSKTEDKNINLH